MDSESPLRFLNIDVSQYIYETYYPTEKARGLKKKINHELYIMGARNPSCK